MIKKQVLEGFGVLIFQNLSYVFHQGEEVDHKHTLPCGLSASYSPSCMAVAILFMEVMMELQD